MGLCLRFRTESCQQPSLPRNQNWLFLSSPLPPLIAGSEALPITVKKPLDCGGHWACTWYRENGPHAPARRSFISAPHTIPPAPSPSVTVEGAVAQELSRNWLKLDHQLQPSTGRVCLSTAAVALVSQPDSILDTPGKREPQLENCLHEISLWGHSLLH